MMSEDQLFCLTLDLENDWYFDESGYDHLTFDYVDHFIELITDLGVPLTVFVVGKTLEKFPETIDLLDSKLNCEFHLHSYQHDTSKSYDFKTELQRGMDAFKSHFGRNPIGYRAPQGRIEHQEFPILESEGFVFDSSIFPSYRPGVYNNLSAPIQPYRLPNTNRLLEIPIVATPKTRVPLSHSYVKLFGKPFLHYLGRVSLPPIITYNVHLQDLYQTKSHDRLPAIKRWVMKRNLADSVSLFSDFMEIIDRSEYQPATMTDIIKSFELNECSDQRVVDHQ